MQKMTRIETFLEQFGQATAEAGIGAEAGRVLGWLVIVEPPCQTAEEVATGTGLDTAAVTGMLEGLTAWGMLDRVPLAEKTCFALKPLDELMARRTASIAGLRRALDGVIPDLGGDARQRAVELQRFYALIQEELPAMVKLARTGART